jgi:hypothetical protein
MVFVIVTVRVLRELRSEADETVHDRNLTVEPEISIVTLAVFRYVDVCKISIMIDCKYDTEKQRKPMMFVA